MKEIAAGSNRLFFGVKSYERPVLSRFFALMIRVLDG
jgi:hypothetical protein